MNNDTCHGYTNFQTWMISLWLDDNLTVFHHVQAVIRLSMYRQDVPALADYIHGYVKNETWPSNDLATYLIQAALRDVNWTELAAELLSSIADGHQYAFEAMTGRTIYLDAADFDYSGQDTNAYPQEDARTPVDRFGTPCRTKNALQDWLDMRNHGHIMGWNLPA